MDFAQDMILGLTTVKGLAQNRFRFVKKPKPASFEFRFLARGQIFVYGFTITQEAILEEWLHAMTDSGREVNVFTRASKTSRSADNVLSVRNVRRFRERSGHSSNLAFGTTSYC